MSLWKAPDIQTQALMTARAAMTDGQVDYTAFEAFDLGLGTGDDTLNVDDTLAGSTSTFDLGAYTRHVDTVFARLEALKEEPLHA